MASAEAKVETTVMVVPPSARSTSSSSMRVVGNLVGVR
jgi:hypothetical protein